jgi:hypothetical protein
MATDPLSFGRDPLPLRGCTLGLRRVLPHVATGPLVSARRPPGTRSSTRRASRDPLGKETAPLAHRTGPGRVRGGRPRMPRRPPAHFERASVNRARFARRAERLSTNAAPSSPYAEPSFRISSTSSRRAAA